MSQLEVDKVIPQSGTTLTIGDSGDTITIASGATLSGDLNASNLTSGTVPNGRITGTYTGITQTGTLTSFASTGINDDATSNAITIDSSGNVGIGVTPPTVNQKLFVQGSNSALIMAEIKNIIGPSALQITANNGTDARVVFGDLADNGRGRIIYSNSDESMQFAVNNLSEKMRIDSSGRLLVGKTAIGDDTVGVETRGDGLGQFTRSGNKVLMLNRKTSDGAIQEFRKDNSAVGSIGSRSGTSDIYIESASSGRLRANGTDVAGWNSSTGTFFSATDNGNDLGTVVNRWNDLYLGGGVYLGGTGTANKLEDYEEGTWSPAITTDGGGGNSGVTYGDRYGTYTKIGRIVTVHVFCNLDAVSSFGTGNAIISTLPFSSNSASQYRSGVVIGYAKNWDNAPSGGTISTNANTIYLRKRNGTSALSNLTDVVQVGDMNTNSEIILTATYETD